MTTVNGYVLIQKSDGTVLQKWEQAIPSSIVYGTNKDGTIDLCISGPYVGWENSTYKFTTNSWQVPDPSPWIPDTITKRQFYQQLAIQGTITTDEALLAVGQGTLPLKLTKLIAQLPQEVQFDAKMKTLTATDLDRNSSLVQTLAKLFGWTQGDIITFWSTAYNL